MTPTAKILPVVGAVAAMTLLPGPFASARDQGPSLTGRAILAAETLAEGPPSGAALEVPLGTPTVVNGITFQRPQQPVIGFSAIVAERKPGEYLAMPDNGYGGKANSRDFLIRAYPIDPDFKTAHGGSGDVEVGHFIQFRDPNHKLGFTIVNEATPDRLLTGGDIDPESLQRGRNGDFWMGEEFGPWILHFDGRGVLLDPPYPVPGGLMSPNNPFLPVGAPFTQPNSRGLEAMAITPDGKYLYATLEGATVADGTTSQVRKVFEFSVAAKSFTGREWKLRTESAANLVADAWGLDSHRMVVIERDAGKGLTAVFRRVYVVDLK
ncbi:MAG TPA: esterase-like activity of phytase family protein, partial [Acidimicrobiales bacterium]